MRMLALAMTLVLALTTPVMAQQATEIDHYTVHFSAINTSQLPPQVATSYGIQRSSSRALLNITILDGTGDSKRPVKAKAITASARNLTGQTRSIDLQEINESDEAIYYIGQFRVNNMETFDFTVTANVDDRAEPLELKFRQQFYTE